MKAFFTHYATQLCQEKVGLSNPLDTLFLTAAVLDEIAWEHQPGCGLAWRHAAEAALQSLGLDTRYAVLKQRFPQTLASAGVSEAGEHMLLKAAVCKQHLCFWAMCTCTTRPRGAHVCTAQPVCTVTRTSRQLRGMLWCRVVPCTGKILGKISGRSLTCSGWLHPYAQHPCSVLQSGHTKCAPVTAVVLTISIV